MRYSTDDILKVEGDLETVQSAYLKERGWKHTSSTNPACLWLWEKKIKDRTVLVNLSIALSIQEHMDD